MMHGWRSEACIHVFLGLFAQFYLYMFEAVLVPACSGVAVMA